MGLIFSFKVISVLELEHEAKEIKTIHKGVKFQLETSKNLDPTKYSKNDLPTAEGCKAITATLTQALVGNMQLASQKGYLDTDSHLTSVINELKRGLANPQQIYKDTIDD